jgi:hypothetical protein
MNTQLEIAKRSKQPRTPSQGRHTGLYEGPPTVKRQVSSYYDAETAIFKLMTLTCDSSEPRLLVVPISNVLCNQSPIFRTPCIFRVRDTTAYRSTIAGIS